MARPKKDNLTKTDNITERHDIVERAIVKTPQDEKLPSGMTLTDRRCYGQYSFINMTKDPLVLVVYGKSKFETGTYGASSFSHIDSKITSGSTITTPRLFVHAATRFEDCINKYDDYIFYFKKNENGEEKYAEIRCTIETGKNKYLVLNDENLTFTNKKPPGIK